MLKGRNNKKLKIPIIIITLSRIFTQPILADVHDIEYMFLGESHAVSNLKDISDTEYIYSLFCINTQKTSPSTQDTAMMVE
ncbi:hypothetical protein [Zhenhengia yiwuensis]|uniref:hypothetical protein n=1 Tax=Zhenhengia yiwuensis TaxID=2763666 RepID=UPI002A764D83|nr:hypothetical protein [Zhenhengia yiwuensis]MDY3366891.1 hypothetical protein [Zhenhengia yiwuensis]